MKTIALNSQNQALAELQKSIENKDKLVLLIGKTGLGKSFLLERLWEMEFRKIKIQENARQSLFGEDELREFGRLNNTNDNLNTKNHNFLNSQNSIQKIFLFSKPFFNEEVFAHELFESVFKEVPKTENFELLYAKFKQNADTNYIFLLDEVGMYEESLLEKVRLLSDIPNVAFILALHKKQEILQKEHFSSRIFKEIWLKSLSVNEVGHYVRQKFALDLKNRILKYILQISGSNLRTIDKILITFTKINDFYIDKNRFKSHKYMLEMSAFHHGLLK